MNFKELVETSIAQVVSLTQTELIVNLNDEFVKRMVNKGYHLIERSALWKFSEAEAEIRAVKGQRTAEDVPDNLAVPIMLYSTDRHELIRYHDERQKFLHLGDKGIIHAYSLWEDEVRFYPLPSKDESFVLRYYMSWPDLVEDEDEPIIPVVWHSLLTDYASGQLALRLPPTGDRFLPFSKAQPYLESFSTGLQEMQNSDLTMKAWDSVPNYGFEDEVLSIGEW